MLAWSLLWRSDQALISPGYSLSLFLCLPPYLSLSLALSLSLSLSLSVCLTIWRPRWTVDAGPAVSLVIQLDGSPLSPAGRAAGVTLGPLVH